MRLSIPTFYFILFSSALTLHAQGIYIPLESPSMHMLDRFEIKQGYLSMPSQFNTTTRTYKRENIAHYADSFALTNTDLSKQDKFNLAYLQNDNFEFSTIGSTTGKGLWGTQLFKHKAAAYDIQIPDFKLVFNPITYLRLNYDTELGDYTYLNTRGLEMRGTLGKRVGFYTILADEIYRLNSWDRKYYAEFDVLPSQSFIHRELYPTLNYWLASGYVSVTATKFLDFQFGHGRNFLGNGYRSMILSDFAPDNLFLRMNTRIWKINYTNIWGELYDYVPLTVNRENARRHYHATTHASINITKKLNIGLFQTIVFQRDSGHSIKGYDPQYLNPIIFYVPVETAMNSPDQVIVGSDFKYNFAKHVSIYGQAVLSELVVSKLFDGSKWWGNMFAYQIGAKYIDLFNINNLDLQLEYNHARPYMYTSFEPRNSWQSYNQNMAHPIGANFREGIAIIRYQPAPKVFIKLSGFYSLFGNDTNGSNWGKNTGLNYNSRPRETGVFIGQGVRTNLMIGEITASYMIWHNLFLDLQIAYRKTTSDLPQFASNTINGSVGVRWNINVRHCHY